MKKPKIVCLCGSTKFKDIFEEVTLVETLEGNIVLSVGCYTHSDNINITPEQKKEFDKLHLKKIDLADEVYILNKGGYIGESTARELVYARLSGKKVKFLEHPDMEMERLIVVRSEEGTFVYDSKTANHFEDVRILVEEGSIGDTLTLEIREVEEGMYERLPEE